MPAVWRAAAPGRGLLGVCRVRVFGLPAMSHIVTGDAFDVLADMDDESVHAVVCDPPYGLNFMSRSWDDFEPKEYQAWCGEWAGLARRVLKPGGHLLAFSGNRTHHRLFSGVEDAGFEIRDTLTWHYGSGFPKALDVSKAIDKAAGVERELGAVKTTPDGKPWSERIPEGDEYRDREAAYADSKHDIHESTPATDAAREWDGWKTALKPATEFVVCARKPFEGTVAENVQAHGTGALNIDGCRVGTETIKTHRSRSGGTWEESPDATGMYDATDYDGGTHEGRYPANVVFDEAAAEALDREVGQTRNPDTYTRSEPADTEKYGVGLGRYDKGDVVGGYGDSGGPSRYFYTSKATRAERTLDGRIDNAHPTVKPVDLMEWLVRLVTAEGQTVVDPFAGTGTTCRAAKNLGREFIGIEKQAKWADVARVRCGLTPNDPSNVRDDDAQRGIGAFAP